MIFCRCCAASSDLVADTPPQRHNVQRWRVRHRFSRGLGMRALSPSATPTGTPMRRHQRHKKQAALPTTQSRAKSSSAVSLQAKASTHLRMMSTPDLEVKILFTVKPIFRRCRMGWGHPLVVLAGLMPIPAAHAASCFKSGSATGQCCASFEEGWWYPTGLCNKLVECAPPPSKPTSPCCTPPCTPTTLLEYLLSRHAVPAPSSRAYRRCDPGRCLDGFVEVTGNNHNCVRTGSTDSFFGGSAESYNSRQEPRRGPARLRRHGSHISEPGTGRWATSGA